MYSAVSGSVVYLQHEINLNSADCTNPELWKRFEKLIKRPVLDAPWPLMAGSGFLVDSDGTIITNRHVVKISGLQVVRYIAIQSMAQTLDKNYGANFSADERSIMLKDFSAMITNGRYSFSAMLGIQKSGNVSILATAADDEPDLALVKVAVGPYRGLKLAANTAIGPAIVGTPVFSLGYPLGSELVDLFQQQNVTIIKARSGLSAD